MPPASYPRLPSRPVRALACVALLALAVAAPPARAEWVVDAGADAAHDSNVTRAQLRDDIRADSYAGAHAGLAWRAPAGDYGSTEVGAAARITRYATFPGLSNAAVDVHASYWRKLGLGLTAPWVRAAVRVSAEDYRENTRDSVRHEWTIELGRRSSERLDASAGYVFDRRHAYHDAVLVPGISGAVWDVSGHTGFARVGYALTNALQLDAGYAVRRGDVVATTHRNLAIFLASDAIGATDAFGPDFYDYRLRGTTQIANGTLSYALGDRAAVSVGYAYALTRAAQGLDYRNHLVNAAWTYRY